MKLIVFIGVFLICAAAIFAQNGGKAEPNRIEFAKGKSNATLSGTLSNNEEMEYVFGAKAGQKIALKVTSPRRKLFSFRVAGADGINLETEYDSYADYSFTALQTGDYLIVVRKNPTGRVPKAKFVLTVVIK